RGGAPVLESVVPVLHAQPAEQRMEVIGDVPGGIDIGQRGPAPRVHEHAIVHCRPRVTGELAIGHDADPGHHQVAGKDALLLGPDALHAAGPLDGGHRVLHHQLHALFPVDPGQDRSHLGAEHTGQGNRVALDGGDRQPHLPEGRGHLGADEAQADHHRAGARPGRGANAVAILHGTKLKDTGEVRARGRERPVPPPGGDQEPVIGQLPAALQGHHPAPRVDRGGPDSEVEIDIVRGIVVGRIDELAVELFLAAEVALRQGRTIVGQLALGADERHRPVEASLAQGGGGAGPGQRGPDDDDSLVLHRAIQPTTSDRERRNGRRAGCLRCRCVNWPPMSELEMAAASFVWRADGRPDWGVMWASFCDLALHGGPPHRGSAHALPGPAPTDPAPSSDPDMLRELRRGILETTGLIAEATSTGWLTVTCASPEMAEWLRAAIVLENVAARADGRRLMLPAGPRFTLADEVKSVITVMAKTHHYWTAHRPLGYAASPAPAMPGMPRPLRVGVAGPPGAGKTSLIVALGRRLTGRLGVRANVGDDASLEHPDP